MEHKLLSKWSRGVPQTNLTDRADFSRLQSVVQDPGLEAGLDIFAAFLRNHMQFTGVELAPDLMYVRNIGKFRSTHSSCL